MDVLESSMKVCTSCNRVSPIKNIARNVMVLSYSDVNPYTLDPFRSMYYM